MIQRGTQSAGIFCGLVIICTLSLASGAKAHEWMAPDDKAQIKNPVSASDASLARGKELYQENCAACHGEQVKGLSAEEAGLEKKPSDLKKTIKSHSDGDFFWKIQVGRGEMPSFKNDLSDQEIWDIINFVQGEAGGGR